MIAAYRWTRIPSWLAWSWWPPGAVLNSSNELGELWQWLCHCDVCKSCVVVVVIFLTGGNPLVAQNLQKDVKKCLAVDLLWPVIIDKVIMQQNRVKSLQFAPQWRSIIIIIIIIIVASAEWRRLHLLVCLLGYSKSYERILMGGAWHCQKTKWLDFGGNLAHFWIQEYI